MEKIERFLSRYPIFIVLFLLPASWALFVPGYYGASDDLHIAWLFEFHKTIMAGQIPPRFVPDLSFGFGYPLFNFVFPLPFYIAEIFHVLGFSLVDSVKALFFLTIPLSGYFMYLFLKEFTTKGLSLAGAILYVYTPYRAVDLYIRGAIGEVLSFVFLPLIVLSVVKPGWIGIGALSFAGLILTHNITAYMFLPFVLLLYILRIFFLGNKFKSLVRMLITFLLGLLISSYFWIPALLDSKLMKYDTVFNFADHFPTLLQLITPYFGYGASVPGPYDGMSFFLGTLNLAVFILGIFIMFFKWSKLSKDKKIILSWALICTLSAIFLMNFRSTFIWTNLPLLPYFQFPWRFLILTTFSLPIFIIALENISIKKIIPVLVIILTIATSASYFRPQDFLGRFDDYYLNRYIPTPNVSDEYLKIQEEYLRLPKNTEERPSQNYPLVSVNTGVIKSVLKVNDLNSYIYVESEEGLKINYTKYLFPGWISKIDGVETEIKTGKPFGQIEVNVPAGPHKVEISFVETDFKKALDAISLATFLVSLWMVKSIWKHSKKAGLLF